MYWIDEPERSAPVMFLENGVWRARFFTGVHGRFVRMIPIEERDPSWVVRIRASAELGEWLATNDPGHRINACNVKCLDLWFSNENAAMLFRLTFGIRIIKRPWLLQEDGA